MKKATVIILLAILTGALKTASAQESMVPDISYTFLEKLIATAKEYYPRVKSNALRTQIAKDNITAVKISWLDPLSASYIYQPRTTLNIVEPQIFTGYQIGVGINFGTFLQKPTNIKIAREQAAATKAEEDEYNAFLEAEVKRRYFLYIQQLNTVKLFTKALQDAQGLLSSSKLKFEKGEITFEQYSQALTTFTSQAQQKLQGEGNYLAAKASLEELTIKKLEEVK